MAGVAAGPMAPGAWAPAPYPAYAPYPPGSPALSVAPSAASRDADFHALASVSLAAIIALVGTVIGLVVLFGTSASAFLGASTVNSGTSVTLDLSGFYLLAISGGLGFLFSLLELVFYRQAFHQLAAHDRRFATPATLVLLAIVAILIFVAAGGYILYLVYQAILCAGSGNPITSTCFSLGTLLGFLGVIGIAAILALIGWIGLLVGIWRLGTRYSESLFKAGAVLLIFPLLNLIGAILILVAARSAREKLRTGPPAMTFG